MIVAIQLEVIWAGPSWGRNRVMPFALWHYLRKNRNLYKKEKLYLVASLSHAIFHLFVLLVSGSHAFEIVYCHLFIGIVVLGFTSTIRQSCTILWSGIQNFTIFLLVYIKIFLMKSYSTNNILELYLILIFLCLFIILWWVFYQVFFFFFFFFFLVVETCSDWLTYC